jgi:TRAP-type mannitol/chloroaromatic compound transport system permease large subunit
VVPLLVPAFKAMLRNSPESFTAMFGEQVLVDGGVLFFVWFGVMIAMNLQTSFLTPPFGFALFYLKGVCPPEVKTTDIYRGVVPFIIIQLIALFLVVKFPGLITWMIDLEAMP